MMNGVLVSAARAAGWLAALFCLLCTCVAVSRFELAVAAFYAVMTGILVYYAGFRHLIRAMQARRAEHAALAQRATFEHVEYLRGSPVGLYGQYPPARI